MVDFIRRLLPEPIKPYAGRFLLAVMGLLAAILFLTLGFWRTILILLLCSVGYVIGLWKDGALDTTRLPFPGRRK